MPKKYALILNEGIVTPEFRENRGYYRRDINKLHSLGYSVINKNIMQTAQIPAALAELPNDSLGFVWIRMHGSPKGMAFLPGQDITSEEVGSLFASLPQKLMKDGTIFLHSCETGSLKEDFYNNIQFSFAKLTMDLPGVQIIAPSEVEHTYISSFDEQGRFSVKMVDAPRAHLDITVTLGEATKRLIERALRGGEGLSSIEDELLGSLAKGGLACAYDGYQGVSAEIVLESHYITDYMLMKSIDAAKPSHTTEFSGIKKLVEEYHTSVNYTTYPESSPIVYFWATPLGKAITKKQMNIAVYLLKHGADLGEIVNGGKTIYEVIEQEAATSEYYQSVKRSADSIIRIQQKNLLVALEEFIPKRNHDVHDIINQYMFPSHKNPTKGAHVEKVRPSEGSVIER